LDCVVVVVGVYGMYTRYHALGMCKQYNRYEHPVANGDFRYYCVESKENESLTSCLLAATAVLLWFKVLYFLRPFKSAGQFGKLLVDFCFCSL
jgi:hypothetical protein